MLLDFVCIMVSVQEGHSFCITVEILSVCLNSSFSPLCTFLPDHRDAVFQLSLCSLSVQGSNASFGISLMTHGIHVIFGLSDVALPGVPCLSHSCVVEGESVDVAGFSGMAGIWDPVMMSCCLSLHGVGVGSAEFQCSELPMDVPSIHQQLPFASRTLRARTDPNSSPTG